MPHQLRLGGQGAVRSKLVYTDAAEAVADIQDGASIMIGGFGGAGVPTVLVAAVVERGPQNLTVIANGTRVRYDARGLPTMVNANMVSKAICSFPVPPSFTPDNPFEEGYEKGTIGLEVVPQGSLAERLRAGGAGIPAFYTPTGVGTPFADGKEVREINGRSYVLEFALKADFALVKAHRADTLGNLVYRNAGRNFNPAMAMAARVTIAQVDEIVEPGGLDPELVGTPGIFVQRIVVVPGDGNG